jgi:DNA repair protein RecO (recombination protein O)
MGRERLYCTEAVVLKRTDFGEADRLLTLYTPSLGKHRAIAKGVRKLISRKAGHLELFTHSQLLLAKGRALDIVTQAETIAAFASLRADLVRTSRAYYVAELLDRFSEEGIVNHPLFELLVSALTWLDSESSLDLAVRFFELHLLDLAGYRPQLFRCVSCRAAILPGQNYWSPPDGGVLCPNCGGEHPQAQPMAVNALKVLRYLQTHSADGCRRLHLGIEVQREIENAMLRYVTYYLERNLKSIEFIRLLRQRDMRPDVAPTTTPRGGDLLP